MKSETDKNVKWIIWYQILLKSKHFYFCFMCLSFCSLAQIFSVHNPALQKNEWSNGSLTLLKNCSDHVNTDKWEEKKVKCVKISQD